MEPHPDPRWGDIVGGLGEDGSVRPMSFSVLSDLAAEWAATLPNGGDDSGALALLRTARSLFAHAWFDYEFMAVACLVGFQALEAAFRELYAGDGSPLAALVRRARDEGVLPPSIADLADTGRELRNFLSHPATHTAFTVGMAGGMLENTHRLVGLVIAAAPAIEN
jgi:hypothetical protein